jgi:hypothetical protein
VGTLEVMERPIEASTIIAVPCDAVGRLLQDNPTIALPNPMTIVVGAVRRDVAVTTDDAFADGDRIVVPVAWHATERSRLFPTFLGELVAECSVAGTRIVMSGSYRVPLGLLGRFGDGVIGRRLGHEALRSVVVGVVERLESAVDGTVADRPRDVAVFEPAAPIGAD